MSHSRGMGVGVIRFKTHHKVGSNVIKDPIQILDEDHNFGRDLYSENADHVETCMCETGNTFMGNCQKMI